MLGAWTFQACNNGAESTDSVEAAEDQNDAKNVAPEDDAEFMVKAASGGMMEVEIGQMAQQKAQSQRVKDFGAMMVKDHTKANDELKALAATQNISIPGTLGEDHQKHVNDMGTKSGADFDKAYMSMMVDDHKKDISEFEDEAKDGKDASIKAFASNTVPTLKMHLDSAQAIHDQVK